MKWKPFNKRELLLKVMVAILEQCELGLRSEVKYTQRSLVDDTNCKEIPESECIALRTKGYDWTLIIPRTRCHAPGPGT